MEADVQSLLSHLGGESGYENSAVVEVKVDDAGRSHVDYDLVYGRPKVPRPVARLGWD